MIKVLFKFLIKALKMLIEKLARIIAVLNALGDVICDYFEFLDGLSDSVWVLAFVSEQFHGPFLVVKVRLYITRLIWGVLAECV